MYFNSSERILILIDGINLNATHKALGFDIDYKQILALFRSRGQLVRAIFYTSLSEQEEYSPVRPLVDWLEYNGFTLVTKPSRELFDVEGRRRPRAGMQVEMAIDAMRFADSVDHIVLFTGDGSLRSLVEALQHKGKRTTVISTLKTRPPMVADELRRQCDQFVDLADLEPMIGRARLAIAHPPAVDVTGQKFLEPESVQDIEVATDGKVSAGVLVERRPIGRVKPKV